MVALPPLVGGPYGGLLAAAGLVWLVPGPEEFEAARRAVVAVMVRVLAGQPYPQRALGVLLGQSLREHPRPQDEEGTP